MTEQLTPAATPPAPGASYPQPPQPTAQRRGRNVVGIVALVVAVVGFILACIPGALILGWVLLPVGFILGIVAVCLRDKAKWQGITAIVTSVVGTIVAVIVFFAVIVAAVGNAVNDTDAGPASDDPAVVETTDEAGADAGTRANPAALGSTIEGDDWTVVINSVTTDATDAVLAENQFNEAPEAGTEFILVNYTVTFTGDDEDGQMPAFVGVDFVTADGVTVNAHDTLVVAPDAMDTLSVLYNGATVTGNTALQVPTPADGVIAVTPGMFADTVFVAIQ